MFNRPIILYSRCCKLKPVSPEFGKGTAECAHVVKRALVHGDAGKETKEK